MQTTSVSSLAIYHHPTSLSLHHNWPILAAPPTTRRICTNLSHSHGSKASHPAPTTTSTATTTNQDNNNLFIDQMYSFLDTNTKIGQSEEDLDKNKPHTSISSNMWWANLKASLGQRFNLEGITASVSVVTKDRRLLLPHISVRDIRCIDWAELQRRGFQGVVFDKDNTLTVPYSLQLWPPLASSLSSCKSVFGDNIAIFSNSAGLYQYDGDGSKARAVEDSLGIRVIRHGVKKPAGAAEDIEKYFGCEASRLLMIGDRYFTDIVYGNRNGFLTILTEPLSLAEEPFVVKQVRKLEASLVKFWYGRRLKPVCHNLLPQAMECIKVSPPM